MMVNTTRVAKPFRADQVGSLLRPDVLVAARDARENGSLSADQLRAVEDETIRAAVAMQEDLGLDVVTDGEFRRGGWNRDFLLRFTNVVIGPGRIALGSGHHTPTALAVTGKITRPAPIFVDAFTFLRSIARATPKVTIPSPTLIHFRGGRESIDRQAYPDLDAFYADVASVYRQEIADLGAAGCTYVQIDDVNFAYLCDPTVPDQVRAMGEDPATLLRTYARLINAAIADRPPGMTIALHVCRGNGVTGYADGGYEPVAEVLFNAIDVDAYFLEYDSPRAGGFEPLRFLPKHKSAVLGLVSTKTRELESSDAIMRRIDEAARFASLDQLALSTQCGFSSGVASGRLRMNEDDQRAKLQLVVEVARAVWR